MQEEKLPFGGTKPGQYMAQEVPVLYGWGAAPSQRIYKSNEVVGINYANEVVQHKGHHNTATHGAPVLGNEAPKLERRHQGEYNEGEINATRNKVFRNVNEPVDSRVVERKFYNASLFYRSSVRRLRPNDEFDYNIILS